MINYKILIGTIIRTHRNAKGWVQEELAGKMDLTQRQISRFETGKTALTMDRMLHMADVLGIPPSRFFEGHKTEDYLQEFNAKINKYKDSLHALEANPELKEAVIFYGKHPDDIRGLNLPAFLKKYLQIPELERDTVTSYVNKLSKNAKLMAKNKKAKTTKK